MSDSAIATQPLPQKLTDDEPADQNNESSPVDIKAKSPTPSDENSKLPQIVEDKTEQDNDCLIIDDDEEPPTIEKAVGVEQNNEETKQFDDIPTLTIDESANIEKTQKEAEKLSIETNEVEENKEEVKAEEEKTVQSNETNAVQSTSSAEINVESEQASTSQATIPPIDLKQTVTTTAPPILSTSTPLTATPSLTATSVSSALASSMIKKPRKPRGLKNETKKPDMNPAPFMAHLTAQNGVMGTIQMGNNGQPQVLTLPPGFKLPQPINMPPTAAGTTPSLMPVQIRPCYTQTSNGQVFFYPSSFQPGQQLTPPNNNQGAKPAMQRKNGKDKESPVGQKPANPVNNVTTAPMILRDPQGNYRIQMAPGQVPNSQTIQHLFQAANSGMVMKQIPATSTTQSTSNKPGTSANSASQPQFTAAPTNLFYTMRGGTTPIPIRSLNAQPMMNNQYLNLVPVSLPPNVHYQMAAEMHPPPPTLSPNLATPTSKSPKPTTSNSANNNTKKKKLMSGTSSNGTSTSSGMFANVASKFMSTFNVNPPNVTLKAMKISAPVEERPEIDNDPADDEPPPQIECEGPTGNTNSNGRQNQQQQANNSFLQAARNQNIQKSKLPTQPHLKKHYIDGRIVEEELPGYKNNSTPTKQRMLGQPPILPVKERPATVLNNLKTALNRVQPVTAKAPASSRPLSSSFQPPPIVKPANYNPPTKDSPQKNSASLNIQQIKRELKNSPIKAAQLQQRSSDPPKPSKMLTTNGSTAKPMPDTQRRNRGRPPKVHHDVHSDTSFNKSNESINADKPKQKKNREVENLINMDFGEGKSPFETTSAVLYTENVLTSREKLQTHVSPGYKDRASRGSVSSTNSRQLNTRRSTHKQQSSSNLSPPASKRPRRDAQRNISYMNSALFDEEDDEMELDSEKPMNETPVNTCLYCKQPARDPKLPQYCNIDCKRRFKKRQRVELSVKTLNTSNISTSSFKSEPGTSDSMPGNVSSGQRHSLDGYSSTPVSFNIKIQSPTAGPETIYCDGSGNGSFKVTSPTTNGSMNDSNSRELDSLKAIGVKNWTTAHVSHWVELVCGSADVAARFTEQEIDGDALLMLEESQLKQDLGLKLGPYMKLAKDLKAIKSLFV